MRGIVFCSFATCFIRDHLSNIWAPKREHIFDQIKLSDSDHWHISESYGRATTFKPVWTVLRLKYVPWISRAFAHLCQTPSFSVLQWSRKIFPNHGTTQRLHNTNALNPSLTLSIIYIHFILGLIHECVFTEWWGDCCQKGARVAGKGAYVW